MNLIDFVMLSIANVWMGLTLADILDTYKRIKKCPSHYIIVRRGLRHEIYASMVVVAVFITANIAYYIIH